MASRGLCRVCKQPVMTIQQAVWAITGYEIEHGSVVHRRRRDNWICHRHCFESQMRKLAGGEQMTMEVPR